MFGIPVGELGGFATILMSAAAGMIAFFLATFLAIVSLMVYVSVRHLPMNAVDFANTYRYAGLPVGAIVLLVVGSYLGFLWVRRMRRKFSRA